MTNEELFEIVKSHFNIKKATFDFTNNDIIKKATFDFTNNDINLTVVPQISLEYIKFTCLLVDKEND